METFIEGVRLQPCLWNPLHPDYREVHVKEEAWQSVVDHCDNPFFPNIQACKTEWKKLRDNHRDALKRAKLGKNKLLPAQITTWKYAKAMQFLEPHMKYRITENIEIDPPPSGTTVGSKNSEHDVSTTEIADGQSATVPMPKRRCLDCKIENRQESDALESFFNCILQSTKTMPHWMQTQVKKKIFAVIIEAEEYLSGQEKTPLQTEKLEVLPLEKKIKTEIYTDDSCDNDYS